MITLNQLAMAYGHKLLFTEVDLLLIDNTRYALVGANGAGKSTLLKLITGEEEPIAGSISIPKSSTIGWLKQDQYRYEDTIIVDVVMQGKQQLWQALVEKDQIINSTDTHQDIGFRLGQLEEIIAHNDGYTAVALAEKLLIGLGIKAEYLYQPLKALSGGYKLRVLLAQTLFQQPEILLLDEPTNHLDIVSIAWLEKYLKSEFAGLLVFISHDMDFIDRLADHILDVDYGEIREYSGNYQKYLEEKNLIIEQKLHAKKQIEGKIAEMQRFVDRFSASATRAKQAQSRVKMIEKMELPDIKNSSRISPHFHFNPNRPSGKQVLKVNNIAKSYAEKRIFSHLNFTIQRGEKVAIMGANGVGKSTLLKVLLDKTNHDEGDYEWGHEANISYFSQDHHDTLKQHINVLDWLTHEISAYATSQDIRKTLGQVLFTKDDVYKDILSISGGEAARLLLAKMIIEPANILILDEPTNHLDIDATEALADALANYTGTVIVVSHNRHFISKIATRILYISEKKGLFDFKGGYTAFEKDQNNII
jgi:ATPase subunit of ABC transporter with duplicated ATPase domains